MLGREVKEINNQLSFCKNHSILSIFYVKEERREQNINIVFTFINLATKQNVTFSEIFSI